MKRLLVGVLTLALLPVILPGFIVYQLGYLAYILGDLVIYCLQDLAKQYREGKS